jgi:hypothetical protein
MAVIARAQALASALSADADPFGPQVWLDIDHGLVAGVFPNATVRFDFAKEAVMRLSSSNAGQPKPSPGARPKRQISLLHEAKRVGQRYEIETDDTIYKLGSATHVLIHGLELVEKARPGTIEKLSARKKQSKRPVAKARADLYDVKHPDAHSHRLTNGWYVATNNKADESLGVLRQAVEVAGLAWGYDVIVHRTS